MKRLTAAVLRLAHGDDGQDLLEYGFLAALIAVVVMAAIATLGNTINTVLWQSIVQNF